MPTRDSVKERQITGPLPDINDETYPHEVVQSLLDEAAAFSLLAVPQAHPEPVTLTPYDPGDYFGINGGYGLVVRSSLGQLETSIDTSPFTANSPSLCIRHTARAACGTFRSRWLMGPDDFKWTVGDEPGPRLFDSWRSQPFAMLESEVELGSEGDGFVGYGVGRTFPVRVQGRPQLLAAAVGTLTQGRGRFEGLDATFSLSGRITPGLGFEGSISVRAPDPGGQLRTSGAVEPLPEVEFPEEDATYLVLRGQKANRAVRTEYGPPPGPGLVSLLAQAQMRSVDFPLSTEGGLRTRMDVGEVVGGLKALVSLELGAPLRGPMLPPAAFTTRNVYHFATADGYELGTIRASGAFGYEWALGFPEAPGQPGVRFGGFSELAGGTGIFTGVQGTVSLNSAIGIMPHQLSMIHVLRIVDPGGRFRA